MSKVYVAQLFDMIDDYYETHNFFGVFDSKEKAVKAIKEYVDSPKSGWGWYADTKEEYIHKCQIIEMDINTSLAIFN